MGSLLSLNVTYAQSEGGTLRTLPAGSIQSLVWTTGRQNISDQWTGGQCTIYGRTTLTYPPVVGGRVQVELVRSSDSDAAYFYGFISDFRVVYGIVSSMDTWEMRIEGPMARAGRATGTVTTTASASTYDMAVSIKTGLTGTIITTVPAAGWGSTTSAQTFTNAQFSEIVNTLAQTEQGHVVESVDTTTSWDPQLILAGRNATGYGSTVATFADDGTGKEFYEIEFLSAAYNYGSKVIVSATGLADQSSGTGTYTQTFSTINATTGQAADLAGYIKTELDLATAVPFALRYRQAAKTPASADLSQQSRVHQNVTVKFRGSTYQCRIEGSTLSASPDGGYICTLYLSSSLQNAWLVLDDAVYGKLDTGKLGL